MMRTRNIVIAIAAALVVVLLLAGLAAGAWLWSRNGGDYSYGMMGRYAFPWGMHGGMHSWGGMYPFGGGILMLLFWVAILGGGAWLLATLVRRGTGTARPAEETPLGIVRRRYARGEISREEYDLLKETLSRDGD